MPVTDARTLPDDSRLDADIVIIGGGMAGLAIAHEFMGTGARVVVFDGFCHVCTGGVRLVLRHPVDPPFEIVRELRENIGQPLSDTLLVGVLTIAAWIVWHASPPDMRQLRASSPSGWTYQVEAARAVGMGQLAKVTTTSKTTSRRCVAR